MRLQDVDEQNPRLSRDEAQKRLRITGYVRMEGHTATDQEQLDRLYDVIFPRLDADEYSQPGDYSKALADAKKTSASEALGEDPRISELLEKNASLERALADANKTSCALQNEDPFKSVAGISKKVSSLLLGAGISGPDALKDASDEEIDAIEGIDAVAVKGVRDTLRNPPQ